MRIKLACVAFFLHNTPSLGKYVRTCDNGGGGSADLYLTSHLKETKSEGVARKRSLCWIQLVGSRLCVHCTGGYMSNLMYAVTLSAGVSCLGNSGISCCCCCCCLPACVDRKFSLAANMVLVIISSCGVRGAQRLLLVSGRDSVVRAAHVSRTILTHTHSKTKKTCVCVSTHHHLSLCPCGRSHDSIHSITREPAVWVLNSRCKETSCVCLPPKCTRHSIAVACLLSSAASCLRLRAAIAVQSCWFCVDTT